jgi:hypothetical protein
MMSKKILAGIIFAGFITPLCVSALEVHIAPILYIDEKENAGRDYARVHKDLLLFLGAIETQYILNFKPLLNNRINPPESLMDAVTICQNEKADWLIYGYMTRREYSIQGELRLFDYRSREIKQIFYAMDDAENYDRIIKDLGLKVLQFINNTFNLDIIIEEPSYTRIIIPASLGYWTPADRRWSNLLLGIVTLNSGFIFIPDDKGYVSRGYKTYYSTGFDITYRIATGNPTAYPAFDSGFLMSLPLILHLPLEQHEIYAGVTLIYALDILTIQQKYKDAENRAYSHYGAGIRFGYQFSLNEKMALYIENNFDLLAGGDTLFTYDLMVGVNFLVYKREAGKKW